MKEKNTAHKQKNKFVEFLSLLWRTKKVAFFGMVVLIFFILVAIFADVLAPQKMENGMLASSLIDAGKAPSLQHPLGTDAMGVDMLSYMIYGARTSVILGITCTILSTVISVVIGVASAVIGGKFDLILQRFIDAWQYAAYDHRAVHPRRHRRLAHDPLCRHLREGQRLLQYVQNAGR